MHENLRQRFLGWWSGLVSRKPGWVLFVSMTAAVACMAIAYGQLRFQSDRNALVSETLDWNQHFLRWRESFPSTTDLIVVVDTFDRSGRPDEQMAGKAQGLVDDLSDKLHRHETVLDVTSRFDRSQAHPRAMRLKPMDQFTHHLEQIASARDLLESPTPSILIGRLINRLRTEGGQTAPEALVGRIRGFQELIDAFTTRLQTATDQSVDLMATVQGEQISQDYLKTENGRLLLIRVTPRRDPGSLGPFSATIEAVRQILAEFKSQDEYRDVRFGLTGVEVIEADETRAAMRDSAVASLVAAFLIVVLLITAFHSFRVPLLLMVSLAVGMAWSFGFLTLVVGHLQVISVVFTVILLALGVAFGIHLVARFELVRHGYVDRRVGFRQALQDTFETIGPGVVTGALTTSAAFATTLATDFRGVAEMGLIAAAGVILCMVAMFSVLPALLRSLGSKHKHLIRMEDRYVHIFEERWIEPFIRHPRLTLGVAGVLTVASLFGASQMRFDYNLLALLPKGVDSVEWQRRINEEGEQAVYHAVSIVGSMEQAKRRVAALRALRDVDESPIVQSLGGVGALFPPDDDEKCRLVRQLRGQLAPFLARAQSSPSQSLDTSEPLLMGQLAALGALLQMARSQALAELGPSLGGVAASIDQFLAAGRSLEPEARARRLESLQRDFEIFRRRTAQQIAAALDDSPLKLEDLPPKLMRAYVSGSEENRKLAIEIYPSLPEGVRNPLDPGFLGRFIRSLRAVDAGVTGVIRQIYESGSLIKEAYLKAGLYALIVVFVLVWIDFRSVYDAGLTLVPVAVGFAVTFGAMYVTGIQINPANIIVLPLMFGIGVDAGVHILHRYRQDPVNRPLGLTAGTGKGITLTSLTTVIGFGSLLLARHRGIASLGFVIAVGIGLTMLACWTVMPAWLELRSQRAERARGG